MTGRWCSAARALEIAGERWSLLILRNALFAGMTRFTDFQASLGLAPNVLANRLEHFIQEGLMTTSPGPAGHAEYRPLSRGLDFKPVIIALTDGATAGPHRMDHPSSMSMRTVPARWARCSSATGVGRGRAADVTARKTSAMARGRRGSGERCVARVLTPSPTPPHPCLPTHSEHAEGMRADGIGDQTFLTRAAGTPQPPSPSPTSPSTPLHFMERGAAGKGEPLW